MDSRGGIKFEARIKKLLQKNAPNDSRKILSRKLVNPSGNQGIHMVHGHTKSTQKLDMLSVFQNCLQKTKKIMFDFVSGYSNALLSSTPANPISTR